MPQYKQWAGWWSEKQVPLCLVWLRRECLGCNGVMNTIGVCRMQAGWTQSSHCGFMQDQWRSMIIYCHHLHKAQPTCCISTQLGNGLTMQTICYRQWVRGCCYWPEISVYHTKLRMFSKYYRHCQYHRKGGFHCYIRCFMGQSLLGIFVQHSSLRSFNVCCSLLSFIYLICFGVF